VSFHSSTFVIFATLFFLLWPAMRKNRNSRWGFLVVMSFIFYGWWDWRFLFLILGSGLLDFFAGLGMKRFPRGRRVFLILSILGNVGTLAVFKYTNFFIENANAITSFLHEHASTVSSFLHLPTDIPAVNLILPVGISFYTFQSMSYTIDIYRGQLKPTRNVLHFFAYLAMFPQLVAGPIVRAADLLPQLTEARSPSREQVWMGLRLIAFGLFKKTVLANNFAPYVVSAFSEPNAQAVGAGWWLVMILFSFQIYFDFSGYSDIARGLAKWMGYEFMLNFNKPYTATGFSDFWARWHISLSTWFRDYVYIPLGGNRRGATRSVVNLWITMLVSGMWHGASWLFLIWGVIHAMFLSIERLTRWNKWFGNGVIQRLVRAGIVFTVAMLAWVFFRAESLSQAWTILTQMFNPDIWTGLTASHFLALREVGTMTVPIHICLVALGILLYNIVIVLHDHRTFRLPTRLQPIALMIILLVVLIACVFLRGPESTFIYFQF